MFISPYRISSSAPKSYPQVAQNHQNAAQQLQKPITFSGSDGKKSQAPSSKSSSTLTSLGVSLGIMTDPKSVKGITKIITEQLQKAIKANQSLDNVLGKYMAPAYQKAKDEGTLERYLAVEKGIRKFLDSQKNPITGQKKAYVDGHGNQHPYDAWKLPAEAEAVATEEHSAEVGSGEPFASLTPPSLPRPSISSSVRNERQQAQAALEGEPSTTSGTKSPSPVPSVSSSVRNKLQAWGNEAQQRRPAPM